MKRNPLLDTIPGRTIDQSAVTIYEIMADRAINYNNARDLRDLNVKTGAWEEVWKQAHGRTVRAYRLRKKR